MRRLFAGFLLLASGAMSLAIVVCIAPLLAAARTQPDPHERKRLESLARDRWILAVGHDDDDAGIDVDEVV